MSDFVASIIADVSVLLLRRLSDMLEVHRRMRNTICQEGDRRAKLEKDAAGTAGNWLRGGTVVGWCLGFWLGLGSGFIPPFDLLLPPSLHERINVSDL